MENWADRVNRETMSRVYDLGSMSDRSIEDAFSTLQSADLSSPKRSNDASVDPFYDLPSVDRQVDEPQDWGIHDWDDPASIVAGSGISSGGTGGPGPNDTIEGIIVQNGVLYFATVYGLIGDPV